MNTSSSFASSVPGGGAAPLDLVIFGGVGDLSLRKLLPALYQAHQHHHLPAATRIHVLGRQAWDRDAFVAAISARVLAFIEPEHRDPAAWQAFLASLNYLTVDATRADDYRALGQALQPGSQRVHYLATAPSLFTTICAHLHGAGLVDPATRVVLEKPLGHDLASARAINDDVGRHFAESQIYRIDHYLGKETVQNLMVLRFGNTIFEPLWRSPSIRSVQPRRSASAAVPASTTAPARCATWCRTTCCSCCASSRWSRRSRSTRTRCATRSSRCCARCGR